MDIPRIKALRDLNNAFYRANHESFSNTRQSAWEGWKRVCAHVEVCSCSYRVLDVACGNMRFERFLSERFPAKAIECVCLDSCDELAERGAAIDFRKVDVLDLLVAGEHLAAGEPPFDMAVSFGFMHHVPTVGLREALMRRMLESLKPGGVAAVSFWKFAQDELLAARARATTERGRSELNVPLGQGDYLLGWNARPGVYRYCHSFDDAQIDELTASTRDIAEVVDRFDSDGRNAAMNGYAILRRL